MNFPFQHRFSSETRMVISALLQAGQAIEALGPKGLEKATNLVPNKNDPKLVADVKSEEAMLKIVQYWGSTHKHYVRYQGEELGTGYIGSADSSHKYIVLM